MVMALIPRVSCSQEPTTHAFLCKHYFMYISYVIHDLTRPFDKIFQQDYDAEIGAWLHYRPSFHVMPSHASLCWLMR